MVTDCKKRLRCYWIKCIASKRYDRLEGGLRVAKAEIGQRICGRAPAVPPVATDQGTAAPQTTPDPCWVTTANNLLDDAQKALDRCQIDQGWRLLHAARRAEILALGATELRQRAMVLRAEADKLKSWRLKAIQSLLGTPERPEANVTMGAVFEAATLRDEHYDNQAYKDQLLRTQMLALVLILAGVMAALLYVMTRSGAGPPASGSNVAEAGVASFGVVALFGLLGATVSGMVRASDSGQSARIPELTAAIRVTFMRILMGGASAVMLYVFLRSSLGDALGQRLFNKEIVTAVVQLQPYTPYAIAFVAGFSERLVLRAVEAIAGK